MGAHKPPDVCDFGRKKIKPGVQMKWTRDDVSKAPGKRHRHGPGKN